MQADTGLQQQLHRAGAAEACGLVQVKAVLQLPEGTPRVSVQLMPAGAEVTVPVPVPVPVTVSVSGSSKRAVTDWAAVRTTSQVGAVLPAQAPLQPRKLLTPCAAAVRVTFVPSGTVVLQLPVPTPPVSEQLIPAGADVTVPAPVPVPDRKRARPRGSRARRRH